SLSAWISRRPYVLPIAFGSRILDEYSEDGVRFFSWFLLSVFDASIPLSFGSPFSPTLLFAKAHRMARFFKSIFTHPDVQTSTSRCFSLPFSRTTSRPDKLESKHSTSSTKVLRSSRKDPTCSILEVGGWITI